MSDTHDELPTASRPLERPGRALTIGAHPDDAEFGCGATIARWVDAGAELTLCVVTDGSRGSWDPEADRDALVARRIAEQASAGAVLGAAHLVHLGYPDGDVVASRDLRDELARQICIFTPEVVLTHDPWQRYQLHPDHRATGMAAIDAVVRAREPLAMRDEGLDAHRPAAVLVWSPAEPDHGEEVEQRWFDVKVRALLCHSSQSTTTMAGAADGPREREAFAERLAAWHDTSGSALGLGPAETFKRLTP
jgi:LmbE family N-acetylglucosaminyl deacetylase